MGFSGSLNAMGRNRKRHSQPFIDFFLASVNCDMKQSKWRFRSRPNRFSVVDLGGVGHFASFSMCKPAWEIMGNTTRPRAELARISSNRFRHACIEVGRDWSKFVEKTTWSEYPFSTTLITMVPSILLGYAPFAHINRPKLDSFVTRYHFSISS